MRLNVVGGTMIALLLIAFVVAYSTLFTVYQTRQALVVRLGDPIRTITQPGLNVKLPLIDTVIQIDKRILDIESSSQEVIDQREELMGKVRAQVETEAQALGITIVDVRIRRADLPEQNSLAIYQRMQTERQQEAAQFRAEGSRRSQEIRAKADRDVTVLTAEATSTAERVRGDGDAERNRIFAEAYAKDAEFFSFYRAMQAYEQGLQKADTRLLLRPDTDFFRFFADPNGKARVGAPKQ